MIPTARLTLAADSVVTIEIWGRARKIDAERDVSGTIEAVAARHPGGLIVLQPAITFRLYFGRDWVWCGRAKVQGESAAALISEHLAARDVTVKPAIFAERSGVIGATKPARRG